MNIVSVSCIRRRRLAIGRSAPAGIAARAFRSLCPTAFAGEKPPVAPDTVAPFTTDSRISATIEFSLRELASDIEEDIPRRLATIDERASCVHRRVLFLRINA